MTATHLTADAQPRRGLSLRLVAHPIGAYLILFAGVICISFTAILTKWAALPGPLTAAYRMIVASAALAVPFLYAARQRGVLFPRGSRWGVLGGITIALNLGLLNSALLLTSAATATLLDNTAPIWVGIGALWFFRERLSRRYWLGLSLALVGAAVVTGFSLMQGVSPGALGDTALNRGAALALVGAIFYAGYLLTTQRARRDLDTLSYLWLVAASAAVTLLLVSLLLGFPFTGYPLRSYLAIIAMGLLSQVGGWLLINFALGHVSASTAVVVLLTQPVITGLLAIPLLGEGLTVRQMLGGALELAGIYLCLRRANGE